jgi:mannose-6-phosphate isomerase-like protein (cupin superfamily)
MDGKLTPISFSEKFSNFSEQWSPKVIAEMNDYQFKLVRLWHQHENTDETFIVLEGSIAIDFEDATVELEAGQLLVVPRGVMHRPRAASEAKVLLVEPRGVINTGQADSALTAPIDRWI